MKKSLSIISAVLTAGILTAPVYAASPYVSSNFGAWYSNSGLATSTMDIVAGLNVIGAIGMTIDNYRLEAELGNQFIVDPVKTNVVGISNSFSAKTFLVNGYYYIEGNGLNPYFTAGAGPTWIDTDIYINSNKYSAKYTALGYQLGGGAVIPISDHFAIDARYRYFATSTINDNTNENNKIQTHSVFVGFRYEF